MYKKDHIAIRLNKRLKSVENPYENVNNYLSRTDKNNNNENNDKETDSKPSPVRHKTNFPARGDNLFLFQNRYKSKKPSIIDSSPNSLNSSSIKSEKNTTIFNTDINQNNKKKESSKILFPSVYNNNNGFRGNSFLNSLYSSNKSLVDDKIAKTKENILKHEIKFSTFCEDKLLKARIKQEEIKRKNQKRKIKVKLYKILVNEPQVCQDFEKKNEVFNLKVMSYLNSKSFINNRKLFNNDFHFSKNELNRTNSPYTHLVNISRLQQNLITFKDITNYLNENEKKLFLDEPKFYIKSSSHLFNIINNTTNKSLTQKIQEEEIIEQAKKHGKNKSDIIKKKFEENYFNLKKDKKAEGNIENIEKEHKKMINTILKNDLEQKWTNLDKNKKRDMLVKNEIKNCELKILHGKIRDSFEKNKNFRKSFDKNVYYYHKQSMIDRNLKRLCKEKDFREKKFGKNNHKNSSEKVINDIISKIQKINKTKQHNEINN